ncbi:MAG TPA: type II secretion system protein, partial [Desulfonatronum sp.]|nr:type II secretion system protein [Desulfonatronum sp.]
MVLARSPSMNPKRAFGPGGFTLIEILVALMVAGLLTAMVASLLGRSIVAGSALEETTQARQARLVL